MKWVEGSCEHYKLVSRVEELVGWREEEEEEGVPEAIISWLVAPVLGAARKGLGEGCDWLADEEDEEEVWAVVFLGVSFFFRLAVAAACFFLNCFFWRFVVTICEYFTLSMVSTPCIIFFL